MAITVAQIDDPVLNEKEQDIIENLQALASYISNSDYASLASAEGRDTTVNIQQSLLCLCEDMELDRLHAIVHRHFHWPEELSKRSLLITLLLGWKPPISQG